MTRIIRSLVPVLFVCLGTGFLVDKADIDGQYSIEITPTENCNRRQDFLIKERKTGTTLVRGSFDCPSLGAEIKDTDEVRLIWNLKRTAFVLDVRRSGLEAVVFVFVHRVDTIGAHYFNDSHDRGNSHFDFKWRTNTDLDISYIDKNGKPLKEAWRITEGGFETR